MQSLDPLQRRVTLAWSSGKGAALALERLVAHGIFPQKLLTVLNGSEPGSQNAATHTVVTNTPSFDAPVLVTESGRDTSGRFHHVTYGLAEKQPQVLRWIPDWIRPSLDRTELALIDKQELLALEELSRTIGHPIVAYQPSARAVPNGPCSYLDAADLDTQQLRLLDEQELALGLCLVAFNRERSPTHRLKPAPDGGQL